ncbi:MAG: MATE family efflux transporter [Candidatus Sedimenticola sp. (ex Thyasira tokunagai)]
MQSHLFPNQSRIRFLSEARNLLLLALPLMVSQLAQTGMSFVDTVMAGRHSEVSLAAVAVASSLWIPAFLTLTGILMAITPIIAHANGARQGEKIKHTVQQGFWLALFTGVGFMLLVRNLGGIFELLEVEVPVLLQAQGYLEAVSWGIPALALFQVVRSFNEGFHLTRPYMYVSLAALLCNIPLNYIFIYGKLGLPAMGGVGCGWATTLVIWLQLFLLLAHTLVNPTLSRTGWRSRWRPPQLDLLVEILRLGLPLGLSIFIEASMFTLIALFIAKLGATVVAGHQVAMSFASLTFMIPLSLSMAITIRCGYSLGSMRPDRARSVGNIGIAITLAAAALSSAVMLIFPEAIASIYTANPQVKALAVELLLLAGIFQFSDALQVSAAGALRGYKDTRFAFGVVVISFWCLGLPLGYTLGLTNLWGEPNGPQGFWIGLIAGLTLASLLLGGRFIHLSRKWINER